MASALHKLSFTAIRYSHRTCARRKAFSSLDRSRQFHQSPIARARNNDDVDDNHNEGPPPGSQKEAFQFNLSDLSKEERAAYKALTPSEQAEAVEEARAIHDHYAQPQISSQINSAVSLAANEVLDEMPHIDPKPPQRIEGFMAMGEDEPEMIGEDPEFEGDDITSLAHGELEQHREMRQYARLAVWEMPLLYKLRKPFEPPTLERPLRFRSTTYLGESHPAARKIVCEFTTEDIRQAADLTEAQRVKLIKLVGVRYNPDTDVVKMSCETHKTPAQNKKYLSDLVDTLIKEAQDDRDMLEDVPVDLRHHKRKPVYNFPMEWKLNAEKRQKLIEDREKRMEIEEAKDGAGQIVDGMIVVEQALQIPVGRVRSALPLEQARNLDRVARSPRIR
ncbi:uncharacterized protein KY384_006089 [Bacidia gigantensis]|uniref:uncharacterized protein n=1 Tax=Bacidia gigantensis TaxID=2732470 RepID=UPI001D044DC8|nr:uncharacterized protein KY384_006089 [Bacidia gigantensis]KAG8529452.1 hypothetical protein KY384_006089 [Bacidia gigantensis]